MTRALPGSSDGAFRRSRADAYRWMAEQGWPVRLGLSVGLAGFLALMAIISFPLPWTPVPFSMMPFALLVVGAAQRKGWAALSVLLYLAAGALGAPIFAGGESGVHHLIGRTAGYLFGFVAAALLVSWYVERRRHLLDRRSATVVTVGLGALGLATLVALAWVAARGESLGAGYGTPRSLVWLFLAMAGLALAGALGWLAHRRGTGQERLNLFLVMMAAIALIHVPGALVLWALTSLPLATAVALGSAVFLPFDIMKALAATGMAALFLPTRAEVPDA